MNAQSTETPPSIEDVQFQLSVTLRQINVLSKQIANIMTYNSELEVKNEMMQQMVQQRDAQISILLEGSEAKSDPSVPEPS